MTPDCPHSVRVCELVDVPASTDFAAFEGTNENKNIVTPEQTGSHKTMDRMPIVKSLQIMH